MPKISALTSLAQASVDTAADVLPIVDATAPATTKKVTVQAMVNAGLATLTTLPSGIVNASLTSVGTLTALTVSGTSTLGITRVSGADNSPQFGVSGATRGVRFITSSFGSAIEGVDNTLGVSYQPLNIVASVLGLYTTGGNAIALGTSSGTPQMYVTNTTSAVNFAQITGGVTGSGVRYGVDGSDSNITWVASSKGTFGLGLYTNSFSQLQFAVGHIASAVNYLLAQGSGTGLNPALIAQGSDANISVTIASKGSGNVGICTGTGAVGSFFVTHTASGVNWVQTTGSTTGNAVSMTAGGSDTNIDFLLGGKGTGVLRFGTHSAIAAETVTGYITIKDSAGNTRKLAVLS